MMKYFPCVAWKYALESTRTQHAELGLVVNRALAYLPFYICSTFECCIQVALHFAIGRLHLAKRKMYIELRPKSS